MLRIVHCSFFRDVSG